MEERRPKSLFGTSGVADQMAALIAEALLAGGGAKSLARPIVTEDASNEKIRAYFASLNEVAKTSMGKEAMHHADALNSKISALLTHVSLMIAITGAFFIWKEPPIAQLDLVGFALLSEIAAYVVISLLCLRGVWITTYRTFRASSHSPVDTFLRVVRARRKTYLLALIATIVTTSVFMLTLILEFGVRIAL